MEEEKVNSNSMKNGSMANVWHTDIGLAIDEIQEGRMAIMDNPEYVTTDVHWILRGLARSQCNLEVD